MSEPVATFDHEYSDPAAVPVEWEETRKVLQSDDLFWICTVRTDGRPHATPVVAAWAEDAIGFSTGTVEKKFANLRANSDVVLITGGNGWESGLDVVVEGKAMQVSDDDVLTRIAGKFADKWDGRWKFTVRAGCFRGSDGSGGQLCLQSSRSKCSRTRRAIHSELRRTGFLGRC
jgi:general stress protein 26